MKLVICVLIVFLFFVPLAFGAIGSAESATALGIETYAQVSDLSPKAPSIGGPYEDGFSPTELNLGVPTEDSLSPDDCVSFRSATPPEAVRKKMDGISEENSGSWYWPGSVTTLNKLYIQTSKGLSTVAGCKYGGHLPLWAKTAYTGNFFVYEWYPTKSIPQVNWWSWTWSGYMKGWFKGDVSGWHVICYQCEHTSNYVYIYVWPEGGYNMYAATPYATPASASTPYGTSTTYPTSSYAASTTTSPYSTLTTSSPYGTQTTYPTSSYAASTTTSPYSTLTTSSPYGTQTTYPTSSCATPTTTQYAYTSPTTYSTLPQSKGYTTTSMGSGMPTPPDPYSEGQTPTALRLVAPEYRASSSCYSSNPIRSGSYTGSTAGTVGLAGSCYKPTNLQCATDMSLVYTKMVASKHNEYYVQTWPNKLNSITSVRQGEWLQLWSQTRNPGIYWSFEWRPCSAGRSSYPEVKNFGYKKAGWFSSWFHSDTPGWHLLCYQCGDWSNYIYIYVWNP